MSTTDDAPEHTPGQLRQMDEQTARETLTVAQFERWEKVNALHDAADAARERFAEEDSRVADLTVHADADDLGTSVTVFGNDLLVRARPDDPDFRDAAEALDDTLGDRDDEVDELDTAEQEAAAEKLVTMLDAVLVRWDGVAWADLDDPERETVLAEAQAKWGVDGLLLAWLDIAAAIQQDRQERVDVIESFRGAERGGRR